MTLEKRIHRLELRMLRKGWASTKGTVLARTLMDSKLAIREGIEVPDGKQCVLVWCLGIGGIMQPKMFYHGNTIGQTLRKAERALDIND